MRKADLVLASLVVLALAATAVGGLSGDRWTGERTLTFTSHSEDLPASETMAAGPGGARFNWTLPDNATEANLTVSLHFSGQALRGGSATVSVRVTAPTGNGQPPATSSWTIPQGATEADTTLTVEAAWARTPGRLRDTTARGHGLTWTMPLEVVVLVEQPSDLPLAQYAFTAQVSGTVTVFAKA
ncbi:MAG TPA: hypothetical protein VM327_03025 [Candidatus Thermoplasmatota archaeon]|nr:hypothetical protein [Candidatus Thermoplasmatota archaeon]